MQRTPEEYVKATGKSLSWTEGSVRYTASPVSDSDVSVSELSAQSGPSDRAIAQAFRRIKPLALSNDPPDIVIRAIEKLADEIDHATPRAGARDAVCDYGSLAHRLYCAIACNGDSACIFGADPVVRERWISGVEEVLGKATQPAAPYKLTDDDLEIV